MAAGKPEGREAAVEKLLRFLVVLVVVLTWFGAGGSPATAGVRLALVLGNSKYAAVPALDNPSNDAADLAQALRGVGFEVIEQRDASREMMAKAVHDFSERLRGADVALFFMPARAADERRELSVAGRRQNRQRRRRAVQTINLSDIQQEMEASGRTNIIILDACRNNPFAEKLSHGGLA